VLFYCAAMPHTPLLLTLTGPTAVGKTELTLRIAEQLQTAVLSADSRQFYREMHIGTARPLPEELRGIPHYFLGDRSLKNPLSAAGFAREALAKLEVLFPKHSEIILTGGSGLFIKALTDGLDEIPPVPEAVQLALREEFENAPLEKLQQAVAEADPTFYAEVDRQNPRRLLRALEVCRATGKTYSSFRQQKPAERPFRQLRVALLREREELYARINARVDQMMKAGLLAEAERLYPLREEKALQTVGYQELFSYMEGEFSLEEAVEKIKQNTRRYAKRQLTWLRKQPDYHSLHPEDEAGFWKLWKKYAVPSD